MTRLIGLGQVAVGLLLVGGAMVGCADNSVDPERPPAAGKADSNDGWHHRSLTASDGTSIAVDYNTRYKNYSSNKPHYVWYANPFWVSVSGPNVTEDSEIRVVFINSEFTDGFCGMGDRWDTQVYNLDLVREPEGHFSGELNSEGTLDGHSVSEYDQPLAEGQPYCASTWNRGSQLAIVVDGVWLEDPISHSNNFGVEIHR